MRLATYTVDQVLAMARPASYLSELRACATSSDENSVTVDVESECFLVMKAKYVGYQPTHEESARAEQYKATLSAKNMVAQNHAATGTSTNAARGGCGGCKGRQIEGSKQIRTAPQTTGCGGCKER